MRREVGIINLNMDVITLICENDVKNDDNRLFHLYECIVYFHVKCVYAIVSVFHV